MGKKIAQNIKNLRQNMGLSQEDLSIKSGVSLDLIFRIELPITMPGPITVDKLSEALGVSSYELTNNVW